MFKFFGGGEKTKPKTTEVKRVTEENSVEDGEALEVISHEFFTEEMYKKLHGDVLGISESGIEIGPSSAENNSLTVDDKKLKIKELKEKDDFDIANSAFELNKKIDVYNKKNPGKEIHKIMLERKDGFLTGEGKYVNKKKMEELHEGADGLDREK